VGVKKLKKRYSTPTGGEELKTNQKWDSHTMDPVALFPKKHPAYNRPDAIKG